MDESAAESIPAARGIDDSRRHGTFTAIALHLGAPPGATFALGDDHEIECIESVPNEVTQS